MSGPAPLGPVDPFDLPEWLGEQAVTWHPEAGITGTPLVAGRLVSAQGEEQLCDLLAVDEAYPGPVADDAARTLAHQAWQHGQVHLAERGGRLTLAVPGREFTADGVLAALARLALALGSSPARMSALLTVGRDGSPAASLAP